MGLFDFFRRKPRAAQDDAAAGGAPVPRALERNIRKLLNKHLQPEERWGAVQAVLQDHSDAALDAAFKRFGVYVEPSAVDNEEKEYIADVLAGRGEAILPRLKVALREMESVTWLVRIAGRILPRDALRDLLLEMLAEFDTEYARDPERKIQVIMALAEFPGDATATAVARFLEDFNETVRFQAVTTVFATKGEVAREALVSLFVREESVRVKNAVLDGLVDAGWPVTGHRSEVEKALPKGYAIDGSGKIKKRPKA
jgi:hypothetical protein